MRVVKASLAIGMLLALAGMWIQRDVVLDAYASEGRSSADLRLDGLDLEVALTPLSGSPYQVALAPDTRAETIEAAFDEQEAEEAAASGAVAGSDAGDDAQPTGPTTTMPPPPIHGGTARLSGLVTGPDGPVPFATVRLERHTVDGVVTKDVTTDALGTWTTARLLGGRYRIRAWAHGRLTMSGSHVFFLAEAETGRVDLAIEAVESEPVMSLFDSGDIYLGLTGEIAVSVTVRTVDENGLTVVSGLPGAIVMLQASPQVTASPPVAVADHDGVARFTLRCQQLGPASALVQHQADVRSFPLPSCVPLPPPPPPPAAEGGGSNPVSPVGDGTGTPGTDDG